MKMMTSMWGMEVATRADGSETFHRIRLKSFFFLFDLSVNVLSIQKESYDITSRGFL